MPWKLGVDLAPQDQQHVKAAFIHRSTGEHPVPAAKGRRYPVLFRDDREWLAHTRFKVRANGRLDQRARHCWSSPTLTMLQPSEVAE